MIAWIALALIASACDDSDERATDIATATSENGTAVAAPTVSPTRSPADEDLGARLRYEGDFEGAIGVYASLAEERDGDERQQARLAQAGLLYRAKRLEETRDVLGAYLFDARGDGDGSAARFMFASVLYDLGDTQGALDSFESYISADGVAAPYASIERAKVLARLGRVDEAEAAAQDVMTSDIDRSIKNSFALSIGGAFERGGADANALAWYEQAPSGPAVFAARAAVKQRTGDASWTDDYRRVVASFPGSAQATAALAALDAAAVPVSSYARGVVHYRAFRNDAAREAFAAAIAADDNAAEAYYYTAAIDERYDDHAAAIDNYQRAYDRNPASLLADDALWWRGRLLETTGRYAEAVATFATLVAQHPGSSWMHDANFHRGLVLYRSGDVAGAAFAWGALAPRAPAGEERARLLFWQGRAELTAGNVAAATQTLQGLIAEDPSDFYALRAEVLLGENVSSADAARVRVEKADWGDVAAYSSGSMGTFPWLRWTRAGTMQRSWRRRGCARRRRRSITR